MKTEMIVQDYYGAAYFLEANTDKALTVFIVDDNKLYLNLIKNVIKRRNVTVHTFEIGEECLKCLDLKPDLVILDYHLDGVIPGVMKGDQIADVIKQELPDTEIIMISSDQKFKLLMDLRVKGAQNVIYKDKAALSTLKERTNRLWRTKLLDQNYRRSVVKLVFWLMLFAVASIILVRLFMSNA